MREIEHVSLSGEADSISWALEPSGRFSVRSLYRKLCTGTPTTQFSFLWSLKVPLKIRIFLWQLARKRLPSNDNIHLRHGPSNGLCALCGEGEDTNHIFFKCVLAKFMWSAVRELLPCTWNPSCLADVYRLLLPYKGHDKRVLWTSVAALLWADRKSVV